MTPEHHIMSEARKLRGQGATTVRAEVSPLEFKDIANRLGAKVQTHLCLTLFDASGPVYVYCIPEEEE